MLRSCTPVAERKIHAKDPIGCPRASLFTGVSRVRIRKTRPNGQRVKRRTEMLELGQARNGPA